MERIASFELVSKERFVTDYFGIFNEIDKLDIDNIYNNIKLPRRGTAGSAGYDFFSPISFMLGCGDSIMLPLGVRVNINNGWVLNLYPRSSLGFRYRLQLDNTVGIIDSDYYHSDNEGHIFVRLTNDSRSDKVLEVKRGDGLIQGVFLRYGITKEDDVIQRRNGGLGSTS